MPPFLATRYVQPLTAPIPLAPTLGFYLDNVRAVEECGTIEGLLRDTLRLPHDPSDENLGRFWNPVIEQFFARSGLTESVHSDDPIRRIGRMLVVARFDDEGSTADLRSAQARIEATGEPGFVLLEDDHPLVVNAKALDAFCCILSLLSNSEEEEYDGHSFTYPDAWLDFPENASAVTVFSDISLQLMRAYWPEVRDAHPREAWHYFPLVVERLKTAGGLLESAYQRGDGDLLRFVGELLVSARESSDARLRILALVSIIEMLVARNPDTNRFNVEDSISRQFVLKVALLARGSNSRYESIGTLRRTLRTIYARRSAIAHGVVSKSGGKNDRETDEDLVSELYGLVRAVIDQFLKDPDLVRFLKES